MTKTPNLDRVQRWTHGHASRGAITMYETTDGMYMRVDDVRAAYAKDLEAAVAEARREAFEEMRAEIRRRAPGAVTNGFAVACREFEQWATDQRDAIPASPPTGEAKS